MHITYMMIHILTPFSLKGEIFAHAMVLGVSLGSSKTLNIFYVG